MTSHARITKSFRIPDGEYTRRYTPGDVATDPVHAKWAIENGFGQEIESSDKKAVPPKNKATAPAEVKA